MESSISNEGRGSVSLNDVTVGAVEDGLSKIDILAEMSLSGHMNEESTTANEILGRMNIGLARASKKLENLRVLAMHAATKQSNFEAIDLANDQTSNHPEEGALEFDLLSEILESEATELDKFVTALQTDTVQVRGMISSNIHLGETIVAMEEKLRDSEISLKQSQDQVSEILLQSAKLRRAFSCMYKDDGTKDDVKHDQADERVNMQTSEQQRNILSFLEKSLATEMDLEKRLAEAQQTEELKHRLQSVEHEPSFVEEEVINVYEKWFERENTAEVLTGMSKELLNRLQLLQFNLNSSLQREAALEAKLKKFKELESKKNALQKLNNNGVELNELLLLQTDNLKGRLSELEDNLILANSESLTFMEKISSLGKKLKDAGCQVSDSTISNKTDSEIMERENLIKDLKEQLSAAESRAESAETMCKLLMDSNMRLNEELGHLKDACGNMELLERKLKESELKLQHAKASVEASQERENMLYSTIHDMENVIDNLKAKVLKAENRAESTEDNCIILSESNTELSKKLSYLKSRIEYLEASLNQSEEMKITSAADIVLRTKVMRELMVQLVGERKRLHNQIGSLALEKKTLIENFQETGNGKVHSLFEDELTQIPSAISKMAEVQNLSADKTTTDTLSEGKSVGKTDATLLTFKRIFAAVLVLLLSAAVYGFREQ